MTNVAPANTIRNIMTITKNVMMNRITLKKQKSMISEIINATSIENKKDREPILVLYNADSIIPYLPLFFGIVTWSGNMTYTISLVYLLYICPYYLLVITGVYSGGGGILQILR